MSGYVFAVVACAVVAVIIFALLRTRKIREKYAGIWIALAGVNVLLAFVPDLAVDVARLVGVTTPVNLLFASAFVVLLIVCVHLSTELSRIEDQARTVAEEVALLRLDIEDALHPGQITRPPVDGP
jgi:hypothetical protein